MQENSCRRPSEENQELYWIAVNLIDDKVLKKINVGKESPAISTESFLRKYGNIIDDLNYQYGIVMETSVVITINKKIQSRNDVLTVQLELSETVEGEDAINPGYRKYQILLFSKTKGTKVLAHIKSVYEPLYYWGYIRSPFEERIALLFIGDFRGCDAFPQMRINIVGAGLVNGFKVY